MWVVVSGTFEHGYSLIGPFKTPNDATEYAEHTLDVWEVVNITEPDK